MESSSSDVEDVSDLLENAADGLDAADSEVQ